MKWWQVLGIIVVGLVLLVLLLTFVPGGDSIKNTLLRAGQWLVTATAFVTASIINFVGIYFLAYHFRRRLIDELDQRWETSRSLSFIGHTAIVLLFGLIAGVLQLLVFRALLDSSPQFYSMLYTFNGAGPFENQPMQWVFYGFLAFTAGYIDWSSVH